MAYTKVTSPITISSATFYGRISPVKGGAVLITSSSFSASIIDCTFTACQVSDSGGAVFAFAAGVSILRCFFSCCADQTDAGCAWAECPAGLLSCNEAASTASTTPQALWYLEGATLPGSAALRAFNVTDSRAILWACGVLFDSGANFSVAFCEFRNNTAQSLLVFAAPKVTSA
jgi:hypothetical protein